MHPNRFREELKRFDRKLDFLWNGRKSQWEVIGVDRRNRTYLIKAVPLGELDKIGPWIIQALYDASPTKQGGAEAVNRRLDETAEAEERALEKKTRDVFEEISGEVFESWQRRDGERINNAGVPYIVRDKRRFKEPSVSNKPVGVNQG